MKRKILLVNWTHKTNIKGGSENRYSYLKQIFPEAELISYSDLFNKGKLLIENYEEAAIKLDEYYKKRYEEDKNILIIRDAEVGGILDTSHIPQITIFGNPYNSIKNLFGINYSKILIEPKNVGIEIAVSNFMKQDMKLSNLIPSEIIPNPVDIDFFKPLENKQKFREKYGIPKDKKVGMWVGSTDNLIKNIQFMMQLIKIFGEEIFWILVTKNKTESFNKTKAKVFHNLDKETMKGLYNCSDFYILTSPIEGCNHTIFEAMACDVPCIVSPTGYFWDFWDKRIGLKIDFNDLLSHVGAIKIINDIKTNPRQVIIDRKLDLKTWGEKWKKLIKGEKINEGKIYIDVGGMYGQTIDKWLREGGDNIIYTLEPNPKLYESLKKKYSEFENVVVLPIALWDKTCTRDFYVSKDEWGSSLHEDKKNLIEPDTIKVKCVRTTEFINDIKNDLWGDICLHLNCEGAEFEIMEDIIKSGAYKKIKRFEIAFHHQEYRLGCKGRYEKLINLMKEKEIKFENISDDKS